MKFICVLSFLFLCGLSHPNAQGFDGNVFHRENNLIWGQIDNDFYNGAFIGDGVQGAMIMQDDQDPDAVRMLLGHYQAIAHQTIKGWEYANSRVYAGNIIINPVGTADKQSMLLDIYNGEAKGEIKTSRGAINWSAISDRLNLVFAVRMETTGDESGAELGVREEWGITPRYYLEKKDPYTAYPDQLPPQPVKGKNGDIDLVINKMRLKGAHVVASKVVELNPSTKVLYVAVGVSDDANVDAAASIAEADAVDRINAAVAEGYATVYDRHTQWWNGYMDKATLSIQEDPFWQKFWWLQIYKLACASSESSSYLIDTQGPWVSETAWAGVWWNLNIQLSYFPIFSSNRLEAGRSLINGMNRLYKSGVLGRNAGGNGIYVGRSSTYDGSATWGDEFGNLPWILNCYYKYWKYSGDDAIGKALFPMLKDNMKFLSSKMTKDANGKYHVVASRSPEYDDQILYEDANYALMSIDWLLRALLEMDAKLGFNDSQRASWQEKLDNLTPLPANANGYMINPTQGFDKGHRHYSHLLSIYPYHTITTDKDPSNLIGRSVDRWLTLTEAGGNAGYTYTAGCAMRALQGNGNEALRLLEKLRTDKLQPNSMYAEGGGAVIETPLSGVESINYLLLQSFGGIIKVFPAVPSKWKNVSFKNFRTEGAFLVSANLVGGAFETFDLESEKGNVCTVRNPWTGYSLRVLDENGQEVVLSHNGNDVVFETVAGTKYKVERINNPSVVVAKVQNMPNELEVEFDYALDVDGVITGFGVADGLGTPLSVTTAVLQEGAQSIKLTLQSPITKDTELKLSYADGNVQSVYGMMLENFKDLRVDNLLAGSSPVLVSGYVAGREIVLNFNKDLLTVGSNDFSVLAAPEGGVAISQILWSDEKPRELRLLLTQELYSSHTVDLSYNGSSVSATDNGLLKPFSSFRLENFCSGEPPLVETAIAPIAGTSVELTFNKEMSEVAQEILFFELKADGLSIPITGVAVTGSKITFMLGKTLESGQVLLFSYLEGGNVVAADGGRLAYFSNVSVVNHVVSKYIVDFSINSSYPNYEIDISEKGKVIYNDRAFAFGELPEQINRVEFIRWSNNMKTYRADVVASFKTTEDGQLFIAHDNRISKPSWLKDGFKATDVQFYVNDALMTLYKKDVRKNTLVELGANQISGTETGSCTNYVVFFKKANISTQVDKPVLEGVLRVMRNPAVGSIQLWFENETPGRVEIIPVSGTKVYSGKLVRGMNEIESSNWAKGIYLIRYSVGDLVGVKKVVVE